MSALDASRIREMVNDSLFRDEEIVEKGVPPSNAVIVEGINVTFGFNPDRLESYREEVIQMLQALPHQFREDTGGGWTFLNMCLDQEGNQWGEHPNMQELMALAIGLDLMYYVMPRDMWSALPGGMPYLAIKQLPKAA